MTKISGRHVVVIGAGAIGTVSAIELLRDGHRGEQAASYGNAGWPAHFDGADVPLDTALVGTKNRRKFSR